MRRSVVSIVASLLLVATIAPPYASATDPGGSAPPNAAVPPLQANGPIVLPNGRVLPLPPKGAIGPSEMAVEWQAHQSDRIAFTPGATPRSLRAASGGQATQAFSPGSGDAGTTLIPLANPEGGATATLTASLPNGLRKQVFGFLPYWKLGASDLQWMRYDLVSTIAYFGVAARADGSLATTSGGVTTPGWAGWNSSAMTSVINSAHSRGDRVVLTITMMAWDSASASAQATLLGSSTYRSRLVSNIIATVKARHADGVNLDFEPLATSLRSQYTSFVRQLKAALVAAGVGSYLTVCTTAGAATWSTGYDVTGLTASGASDGIFVMGYDYSWSGSSRAGGVAPMSSSYMLDVNESVTDFLSLTTGAKLIWGVPYYGRTWWTSSNALNAATISAASGQSKAYEYTGAKSLAGQYGRRWDSVGQVPWFVSARQYSSSVGYYYLEGYYDDAASLGVKYDMINQRGLAGVGMWHLLMDEGVSELWNLIANKFQKDTLAPTGGITQLAPVTDAYAIGVSWRAIDVGSGVASYSVQYRDRASSTWVTWFSGTTATSATFIGSPGHAFEFRVAARDKLGNTQPWVAAMANPGASLTVGGFAAVAVDGLNVRSGAGTGFTSLAQLPVGSRVAILSGPISAGGYQWYQVQFGFSEWPSADYPRTGWAAAGDGTTAYLVPTVAPTVTTLAPRIGGYATSARLVSPNGDGRSDAVNVSYSLPVAASSVRLDVLSAAGTVIDTLGAGAQDAGGQQLTWDGRTSGGVAAPGGTYLLRLTVIDASGTHTAPTAGVNAAILSRWGVTVDLTAPSVTSLWPSVSPITNDIVPRAAFSEPVTGISGASFTLTDVTAGTSVAASVSYNASTRTASLTPSARLAAGHTFRAALGAGIMDLAGNPLASRTWTFATPALVTVYNPVRSLTFAAGTTVGYRFDSTGKVIASKSYTLSATSHASTSQRSRAIPGHSGAWFLVTNGVWAGYWVAESSRVYLPGLAELVNYATIHPVSFSAGTYTAYRFDSSWRVVGSKRFTLSSSSSASTSRWAVVNGRTYAYITNGVWGGYWMPVGGGVVVR